MSAWHLRGKKKKKCRIDITHQAAVHHCHHCVFHGTLSLFIIVIVFHGTLQHHGTCEPWYFAAPWYLVMVLCSTMVLVSRGSSLCCQGSLQSLVGLRKCMPQEDTTMPQEDMPQVCCWFAVEDTYVRMHVQKMID